VFAGEFSPSEAKVIKFLAENGYVKSKFYQYERYVLKNENI